MFNSDVSGLHCFQSCFIFQLRKFSTVSLQNVREGEFVLVVIQSFFVVLAVVLNVVQLFRQCQNLFYITNFGSFGNLLQRLFVFASNCCGIEYVKNPFSNVDTLLIVKTSLEGFIVFSFLTFDFSSHAKLQLS
ncbi:hypothetical protein CDO37_09190 [Pseudomonas aeruginosa]|nr:hypothetical protein CDO37_09190 [Pseudomonas aeruginosa]